MKRMDPKKYCTDAVERKSTQKSKRIHCKKSQQWAMRAEVRAQKPANTEGEQSQQPMTTLEDKGRHTYRQHTPGRTESRGQEIVETMPLPTKWKAKWEVKLWEEEEDERTEETTGGADQIEDNKKEDSLFGN